MLLSGAKMLIRCAQLLPIYGGDCSALPFATEALKCEGSSFSRSRPGAEAADA
jgi:hypothetical protein